MAELILDGYSQATKLNLLSPHQHLPVQELTVLSRPLPPRQARMFLQSIKSLPEPEARRLLHKEILARLVEPEQLQHLLGGLGASGLSLVARSLLCPTELQQDADNLRRGLTIEISYPHLARVTCEQCRAWWFDPIDGTTAQQNNQPLRRPDPDDVMCEGPRGCPKGHFKNPTTLSEKNRQAWLHFQECDATGVFPDDPMVAHNANIIRDVLAQCGKERQRRAMGG